MGFVIRGFYGSEDQNVDYQNLVKEKFYDTISKSVINSKTHFE